MSSKINTLLYSNELQLNYHGNYLQNFLRRLSTSSERLLYFTATFLCGVSLLGFLASCKKKPDRILTHPPELATFKWVGDAQTSVKHLEKAGWKLKFSDKNRIWLVVPYKLDEENIVKIDHLSDHEVPVQAELQLYTKDAKLMMVRLHRHDTVPHVEKYYREMKEEYGLEKAIWSSKPRKSVDSVGNNFIKNIDLFETKKLYFVVYHSLIKVADEKLDKGRNYRLELTIYSKLNEGLNTSSLIKRLERQ